MDTEGHGTWCSAIAAGIEKGDFCGVAYHASLLICKVRLNPNLKQVIEALKYIDHITNKGTTVHIVSMSFGYRKDFCELKECIDKITKKGIICVAAAGNDGNNPTCPVHYPAKYENVISVGAHTQYWKCAEFSPNHRDVNYATLGVAVRVPHIGNSIEELFTFATGTSLAAPAVAGLIACILERQKNLKGVDKEERINKIKKHLDSLIYDGDIEELNKLKALCPHKMFNGCVH